MKIVDVKLLKWVPTFVGAALFTHASWAGVDLSVGGSARSYPLSGVMEAQSGYGVVLYGAEGSPFSGYIRPAFEGYSAATYNSGVFKLEIFPLAILGGRVGGESVQNDREYSAYDCATYTCEGRFYRTFAEAELSLGYGPVFLQGKWRRERWTQDDKTRGDFVEPTSGLVMAESGEAQTVYQAVLGIKLSAAWTVLGGVRYAEGETELSRMPFGLLRFTSGGATVALGGGQFESELKDKQGMILGYLNWEIWPSVGLR